MGTPGKDAPATATAPSPSPSRRKSAKPKPKPTTLLDVYEVEWITRELERLLARESGGGGAVHDGHHHHHRHHHRRKTAKLVSPAKDQKPHPHAKKGGFLTELIGKHATSICGDDTLAGTTAAGVSGCRRRGRGGFREVDKL